mgnify:CR=1 FL=1
MATKNAMTADYLRSAYGGESLAHMRYLYWADVARDESLTQSKYMQTIILLK